MPKKKRNAMDAIRFRLKNLKSVLKIYKKTDADKFPTLAIQTEAVIEELESLLEYLKE